MATYTEGQAGHLQKHADIDTATAANTAALAGLPATYVAKGTLALNVKDYGAIGDGVTNDTAAIDAAITAAASAPGSGVYFPAGRYVTSGGHVLNKVTIFGPPSSGVQPILGNAGATILVTGTTNAAFTVNDYYTVSDLTIIYPNQVDTPTAPIVYPATFRHGAGSISSFGRFQNLNIYNAYDLFDLPNAGLVSWVNVRAYTVNTAFTFSKSPETLDIRGCFFSFGFFNTETMHYSGGGTGAGASFNLRSYTANNAVWCRVTGDATAVAQATNSVDALIVSDTFLFGYRTAVEVSGGRLMAFTFTGGEIDACQSALRTTAFGAVYGGAFNGARFYGFNFVSAAADTPFFDLSASSPITGASGSSLSLNQCWSGFTSGTFVSVVGANWDLVQVAGCDIRNYGKNTGGTSGPYYGVKVDSTTCTALVSDTYFSDALASGGAVNVVNATVAIVKDVTVGASFQPVAVAGAGKNVVDGLTVAATGATFSVAGSARNTTVRNSSVDKPNSAFGDFLNIAATASGETVRFFKDRAGAAVQSGDTLGSILGKAFDGTAYQNSTQLLMSADGAPGASGVPGRFAFLTGTPTTGLVERLRIANDGTVSAVAGTVPVINSLGHVVLRSYTVTTLPSAVQAAQMIYVSNGTVNKRLAISDGTAWRWPDGAVVS